MTLTETRIALPTGVTLNVQTGGERGGAAIILLHGFPESHRTWRAVAPALAEEMFVIVPDQRGFAASDFGIVTVSTPTPPGTGVYALDRSSMSTGFTSPTSTLPRLSNAAKRSVRPRKMRSTSSLRSRRFMPTSITTAPGWI